MKTLAGLISAKLAIAIPTALVGGVLFLLAFSGILVILFYIFKSVGIYSIAKNRGVKAPGLAWLPLFDWLILGRSADHLRKEDGAKHSGIGGWIFFLSLVVLAGDVAGYTVLGTLTKDNATAKIQHAISTIAWFLPVMIIVAACSITLIVLKIVSLGYVYEALTKAHVALLILSIIFAWLIPVFLFAIRKRGKKKDDPPFEGFAQLKE